MPGPGGGAIAYGIDLNYPSPVGLTHSYFHIPVLEYVNGGAKIMDTQQFDQLISPIKNLETTIENRLDLIYSKLDDMESEVESIKRRIKS